MRCYRKILHISYKDHVTNEEVHAKIQQAIGPHEDLMIIVKRCKLQWYGNVSHSSGLAKTILQGTVKGGRRQGGQRKRWEDNIKEWTGLEFGKSSVVPQRPSRLRDWWWWWWWCFSLRQCFLWEMAGPRFQDCSSFQNFTHWARILTIHSRVHSPDLCLCLGIVLCTYKQQFDWKFACDLYSLHWCVLLFTLFAFWSQTEVACKHAHLPDKNEKTCLMILLPWRILVIANWYLKKSQKTSPWFHLNIHESSLCRF